jgi:tetratricopeptide (TPR) repeat protein
MELGHSRGPQRKTVELIAGSLGLEGESRAALLTAAEAGRQRVFAPAPAVLAMPRGVTDFVGRTSEADFLARLADSPRTGPAPVVVVSGAPGVGKTSFAVQGAAELAQAFPDGQFFVDLRGLDEHPLEPAVILGRLIGAVAPGQRDLPRDEAERAGLFRTLLTGRRVFIVLDNAADEAQVRPLLPGAGASLMLITSRRRLTGLDTPHRLSLVPLSQVYAVQLLTSLMGAQAPADSGTAARLAELGGNLPLALRIIGNRLAGHAGASAARFVARLSVEERRLETLTAGDMRVSAVFSSSYLQLSAEARQLFRRLPLAPSGDTGPEMAAVLAEMPLETAELALDELVEYGLLQSRFADRYRLHDLLRLFARARLGEEESPAEISGTQARVEDWLLSTATVAGRWFEPDFGSLPPGWDDRVPLETSDLAQQWIESEADNWLAALRTAASGRRFAPVVEVAEAMHWFSDRWSRWGHWTEVFRLASVAAAELGDARATATQLNYLSWSLNVCDGDTAAAIAAARRAYAAAASAGDARQQGWSCCYEAGAQLAAGDALAALTAAQQAQRLLEPTGDPDGLAQALLWTGWSYEELGRTGEALELYRRQLARVTEPGAAQGPASAAAAASAAASIARLYAGQGDWGAAVRELRPAVTWSGQAAIPELQAQTLLLLGEAQCETGHRDEGLSCLRTAGALYEEMGAESRTGQVQALLHKYAGG